ncbi:sensor histidine kinase [Brevibacterium jeotgali]|uniref:histidine kinase n=1 Tax=Brevibacterium jeotgali TaxID=1262550 RepID=A0A2H1L439_9MICO|nr:signal transduction histidine kinase [Brevibacterium jeotgali]SMY11667.1 HAMP domain-containing protein [Brevibacterium jeotgali]
MTRHTKRRRRVIWEEWSLTAKLLTIMMTLMLVVLTGTSAWVLENLRSSLIERTDAQLIQASEALAIQAAETVLTPSPLASSEDRSPTEDSLRQLLPGTYYVQFYDGEGSEVYSPVAPIDGNEPQLPVIDEQTVSTMQGAPFTTDGSESQWRVRALRVENSQLLVAIAVPFDQDIDAVGERARNTVLGIGMLALALVAGVGYFAITNTFRPLHDIENTASKIAAGDLSQRVSTYPSNTELGRLSAALNTMLGHIEDSFDGRKQSEKRIRQFVSDASHELRTPLVTIRGYAELYRQGAITDPDQVGQAMERMESEAKRMTVLVEDLVQLARLDERRPTEIGPVDMTRLVRDGAADALAQAPDRDISLIGLDGEDAPQTPMVLGSEARLRQVIVNLAGNAVRHTTEGTEIEFAVGVVDVPHQPQMPQAPADARRPEARKRGLPVPNFLRLTAPWGQKPPAEAPQQDAPWPAQSAKSAPTGPHGPHADEGPAAGGSTRTDGSTASASVPPGDAPSQTIPTSGLTHSSPFVTGPLELGEDLSGFPYGRVRFELRDHGEGIAPDQVARIFERFYRLDSSRGRDTGGSGLGLSIVKAIVDSHSGAISVHPTPGGGATFRVDMPIPGPDSVRRQANRAPSQATPRKDDIP